MNNVRIAWWAAGCAVVVALGACRSGATRIYTLETAAPASHVDVYRAPPLRVDILNVPVSWERTEILRLTAAGPLQISDFDHWAAPLSQMARQTLSEDLDQRLPSGSVIYPRLPKPIEALGVDVDILDFHVVASQATMRASWTIVPSGDAQAAKRSAAELHSSMSSDEPSAVVQAWSDLIGQLADRIAADASAFNRP